MDLRIEKTYRALIRAFTELLEERHYEEVSVALLCERAMIRRTTFYKHFADKDEFFVFFMQSLRDEFQNRSTPLEVGESERDHEAHMLSELVDFVLYHDRLVDNVMQSSSSGVLFDSLSSVIARDIAQRLETDAAAGKELPAPPAIIASFCAGGIVQMLRSWWTGGRTEEGRNHMMAALNASFPNT